VIAAGGCGGSAVTSPSPTPVETTVASVPSPLRIVGDPVVDITRSEARRLQVEERDTSGVLLTRAASAYSWSSSDPDVVSVGADGTLQAREDYGTAVITVRSPAGLTTTARIWVQLPAASPSTFHITLMFGDDVPEGWRSGFEWAAQEYERVIRASLPAYELNGSHPAACADLPGEPPMPALTGAETGTRIYIGRSATIGGPTTGQPCIQRPLPRPTSVYGRITIPRAVGGDDALGAPGHRIALHEIGHALGLVGLSVVGPSPGFDPATLRHSGPLALEGYRRAFGASVPFLQVTGSHWAFGGDIMSEVSPEIRITKVSAGALMDMGYPAAWYGAY
jgi:hypothetical protein